MVVNNTYAESNGNAFQGAITDIGDVGTDIRVALLSDTHTPGVDTHDNWDDVSADEVSGTNYTAGGEEITNKTWSLDGSTYTFDGDNVTWADSTISAGYAVIYDDTPEGDTDKKLLCLVDFEGVEESEDGDFTLDWDASGIFSITANPS